MNTVYKEKQHSLSEVLLNKQLIISLRTVVHDGLRCFATVRVLYYPFALLCIPLTMI